MKKYITDIKTLAALLMAGAAFTACSDKDEMIGEQTVNPVTKYTMTVNATKGDDGTTRALDLSGTALKVKWAGTDQVSVFPAASNGTLLGTLTATASETGTTTLTGDLTGSVNVNDNLNLLFPRAEWEYTGQKGILLSDENSIEKKYDYAQANVTVAAIDNSHITTTANANFASQQAIVKFILKDKATGNAINANKLTISAASNKLVTKKTLVGIGDKIYHSGYTVTAGSGGFNDNESHTKLVDGDLGTKWCANNGHKSEGVWYIEFNTASPIKVDGYMLRTGGDTGDGDNWQRNPKSWELKGKANSTGAWTSIDAKSDYTEMPHASNAEKDFNASNPGTYQYFRLEISATGGDLMQLSEMKLFATATEATEINAYGPIVVTPSSATNVLTVALRNENAGADTYNLTAVVDGIAYTLGQPNVTFDNGKYYEITAKLTKQTTIDLSTVTTDITVPDGFTLTGTLDGAHKISIADGATVTLDGVTINGVLSDALQYAGITCLGDAIIILKDGTTNTVNGNDGNYPGIQAGGADKTLTITGSGSLNAHSNGTGAGIGSAKNQTCGNIVISGGTITATNDHYGAGIGSGYDGGCGTITISGGTIMATGGSYAAGIGSGYGYGSGDANCGNITITSGVTSVTATKGSNAPNSIGAGYNGTCGTVTIGGVVTGNITDSPYTYPAPSYTMAAAATTSDKGKLICTAGHIHVYGEDAACTAGRVAKIIYVGTNGHATYSHGLALALTDEGQMTWGAAMTACNTTKNTSTPVTGATWLLASKDQWDYMLGTNGAGSYTALRDGFTSVGGSNLQSDDYYWSSTEYDSDSNYAWGYTFVYGNWSSTYKGYGASRVRACLAF